MEKKSGFKSLFNLFDIAVIVVVIALGAVLLLGRQETTSEDTPSGGTVRYTVEVSGVPEGTYSLVSIGDPVVDRVKKYNIGTVEAVSVEPAYRSVTDYGTNTIRRAQVPGQETLYITITAPAVETDAAILVDGGYEIRTGASVSLKVPGFSAAGYVVVIERGED